MYALCADLTYNHYHKAHIYLCVSKASFRHCIAACSLGASSLFDEVLFDLDNRFGVVTRDPFLYT